MKGEAGFPTLLPTSDVHMEGHGEDDNDWRAVRAREPTETCVKEEMILDRRASQTCTGTGGSSDHVMRLEERAWMCAGLGCVHEQTWCCATHRCPECRQSSSQ